MAPLESRVRKHPQGYCGRAGVLCWQEAAAVHPGYSERVVVVLVVGLLEHSMTQPLVWCSSDSRQGADKTAGSPAGILTTSSPMDP